MIPLHLIQPLPKRESDIELALSEAKWVKAKLWHPLDLGRIMKILVNYFPALKQRTGIGHYTGEMVKALCQNGQELDLFPSPNWEKTVHRLGFIWKSKKETSSLAKRNSLTSTMAGFAKKLLKDALRHAYAFAFSRHASVSGADLYFEPNFLAFETSLPTVTTIHDLGILINPSWHPADRVREFETRIKRTIDNCKHFFAVSNWVKMEMIQQLGIAEEKITVARNGVREGMRPLPVPVTRAVLKDARLPQRYFLHIGTVEPRKNLLFLMKAYCALPEKIRQQYPLLLVGGWGWNAKAEAQYYDETGRHRGVQMAGYIPEETLPAVYNGARALLFPTLYEGFGFPTVEMMACGGPVIASHIGVNEEVSGGKALLLDPVDQSGWTEAIARMALDDAFHGQWCKGVRENAARFTWDNCAREALSGFQKALGLNNCQTVMPHFRQAG